MLKENDRLLEELSRLFLSYRDPDEAYCKILREVENLYNREICIDISKVQEFSYNEKEV